MNIKLIIAFAAILAAVVFGSMTFFETNVEYGDFQTALANNKKIQVKGEWDKDKETIFDPAKGQFIFYMHDDNKQEMKVVFDGAKPNNFEIANAIVAKGRCRDGVFYASEILTKCPSKYEGNSETVKKTI
ncbi:MAG: cytochrome c maturation protein CcmE [Bacteroidota bacterium]